MGDQPIVLDAEEGPVTRIPGETFVVKATGETTGDHLAFAVGEWAPKHGTPSHRHPTSSESFFFLSGTFIIDIDENEHHVGPGSFAFVPPGAKHRITNIGEEPWKLIGFFAPAGPEKGFRAVQKRAQELGRFPDIEEVQRIMAEHGTTDPGPARMRTDG